MKTVRQILDRKGTDIYSIAPEDTVLDAIKLMADKGVGAVLAIDKNQVVGILSERDYARKVVLKGKSSRNTPVSEIMTQRVIYVSPDRSVEECMALMTEKRVRHLPVMEGGALIGIISIGDVVKALISNQKFMIEQLERYIMGH